MVNGAKFRLVSALLLAALVLVMAASLRSAEYDEQYTLFLTAGTPRPIWPDTVFPAGDVAALQSGHTTPSRIAADLRTTDVHPPLYFWAVAIWRYAFGPSLFAARLLSVLCGVLSLALVGAIARRCAIPPAIPILLTLGCYGFVYTNAIARGFAPAQALTLCGIVLLLKRRPLLAGISLGAACCCNYLAVFVAIAAMTASCAWAAILGAAPFLALDAWFFAAQHGARPDQFPPFRIGPSLLRLAEYQIASVFGGLPLYADGIWRTALNAIIGLIAIGLVLCIGRARPLRASPALRMLVAAAIAPPIGLLLLGVAFNNTPIELRYLSFGLPLIALLVAWAVPRPLLSLVLTVQCASIVGLLLSPRTMQPARAAAIQAPALAKGAVVLVPRGNDGVGIVGAFGIEAPPALPILVLGPTDPIVDRISPYRRVAVALLAQDRDSIATIAQLHAALAAPNWHRVAIEPNLEVYQQTDQGE